MSKKTKKTLKEEEYLHGFSQTEQDRLYRQARFLESWVFEGINFVPFQSMLEIGCGVGAQTKILAEKFPHLQITAVDISPQQLARAREHLKPEIAKGQVKLIQAHANELPFADNTFDVAFSTWFLEHVKEPVQILSEVRRVLKSEAFVHLNEVLNATLFLHPYSPATLKYWFEFNDHQWNLGGDPFVGAKLGNYLMAAGFQNSATEVVTYHFDNRWPKKRAEFIDDWTGVLLSGAPHLIGANKVSPALVEEMQKELKLLKETPDSVFFNSWVKAKAQAF